MKKILLLLSGLFMTFSTVRALAAGAEVDPSFDAGSRLDDMLRAVLVQPDGKVVIGGNFQTVHGAARRGIARLNGDGTTDHTFLDGLPGTDGSVLCLGQQSDGKLLIGGTFWTVNGTSQLNLARLNPDGSLDPNFVPEVTGPVTCLALQSDGRILIGGQFSTVNGVERTNIARLKSDGSLDDSFAASAHRTGQFYSSVNTIVLGGDQQIIVAGAFNSVNGELRNNVARLNADGSLDGTFSAWLGDQEITALAIEADGRVLVGGWFKTTGAESRGCVRLNTDGRLDTSFGGVSGPDNRVHSFALQSDGRILIGGYFLQVDGFDRPRVARLNADGSLDTSFIPDLGNRTFIVYALALQPDERLVVAGDLDWHKLTHISRLNGDGSVDATFETPVGGLNGRAMAVAVQPDGKTIVGGHFTSFGSVAKTNLVRLNEDGSLDTEYLGEVNELESVVEQLALQADGKLILCGKFSSVGGEPRTGIARLEPSGGLDRSFAPILSCPFPNPVYRLVVQADNKLLISGSFTAVNGTPRRQFTRLNSDGSLDTSFHCELQKAGSEGYASPKGLFEDGRILIGGSFTSINGRPATNLARLYPDGSLDESFTPAVTLSVYSAAVDPQGRVVLVTEDPGDFFRPIIVRLLPTGTVDPSFTAVKPDDFVSLLFAQWDGKILAAGSFYHINGVTRRVFARINEDGSLDNSFFQEQSGPNRGVESLQIRPDGKIVVVGGFTAFNSSARNQVARLLGDCEPLRISGDPLDHTAEEGSTVFLTVNAVGCFRPQYQWFFNDSVLDGCTNARLRLTRLGSENTGSYRVVVADAYAVLTSAPAQLRVVGLVEKRMVPALRVFAPPGSSWILQSAADLPSPDWMEIAQLNLQDTPALWLETRESLPTQQFYRALMAGCSTTTSTLDLNLVPALTLRGKVGDEIRVDAINAVGPVEDWFALATVTLTNTAQLFCDTSAIGQPRRVYRLTPLGP